MATYTAITDAEIDQDSPITQTLMTKYRDNLIATAEGASGAPRIDLPAIQDALGDVQERDVGSYTFAWYAVNAPTTLSNGASIAVGTEIAGASLRVSTSVTSASTTFYTPPTDDKTSTGSTFPTSGTVALSGTWRLMTSGSYAAQTSDDPNAYTWYPHLWLRIS